MLYSISSYDKVQNHSKNHGKRCYYAPVAVTRRADKTSQDRVKGILKAELARRHLTYKDLAERLRAIGIEGNDRNISNKLARGTFTAAFFIQCMDAIGCRTIHLDTDD